MASNSNPSNNASNLLMPEIGPDGLARENPVIAYTEKMIEAEQSQLRKYIEENYSKIRDVERELASLTMEMKLTAGPKKAALELLRKKIEMSTEKIRAAKLKEEQAKKAWEAASKAVQDEKAAKQKLCDDLNHLVQESSNSQLSRLEELKRRMEALNPTRSSTFNVPDVIERPPQSIASSAVPSTSQPASIISTSINVGINPETSTTITNSKNQTPQDGEGRGKKKNIIQGKVKGIGAVPKGRVASASASASPGWTGAGFDIDGRG